jgi:ATP adenylyltransferase
MDHLWTPWRYRYVSKADELHECVFCVNAREQRDRENLILLRRPHCFVILNLYPYTTGHLMVIPYEHTASLDTLPAETLAEMMELTRQAAGHLGQVYRPRGINIGMNLGECAGAGIAEHLHMHVLPRWPGDVNFMTTIGETRIIPEELETTYDRLYGAFHQSDAH